MRKFLNAIAGVFAFAGAILLLGAAIGLFEVFNGKGSENAWAQIGLYAALFAGCAVISTTSQKAAERMQHEGEEVSVALNARSVSGSDRERDFYTDALIQQVVANDSDRTLFGDNLRATDGMLHSYQDANVSWKRVWQAATARRAGVPPRKERPYWVRNDEGRWVPHSVLAFWGTDSRLRVAENSQTDRHLLSMMKDDPDNRVRITAQGRL